MTQSLLVVLILAGYLLSLGNLPGASVVCYGADGHVAVERAEQACEVPPNGELPISGSGQEVADAAIASCVDIPISGQADNAPALRIWRERNPVADAVIAAVVVAHLNDSDSPARLCRLSFVPMPSSSSHTALRTIILLV
ncbi:MAG: hypothetical protein IT448_05990 [Phycisphaerales bacterium]|nr:hypothetical protein [Phycisphaerales bacterium]